MSNEIGKVYFCAVCGNEVRFEKDDGGILICCGQEMQIKKEGLDKEE
jgi:desulfoferrodoxin-like iron-binding protein